MKVPALLLLFGVFALTAQAQLNTGSLGGSGLNRRPTKPIAPAAPGAPSTQPTTPPSANAVAANGILLGAGWDKRVTGPLRKANHDMADLRACLSPYGEPSADLGLHPDAQVFPGIAYLTPFKAVEAALSKQLGGSLGIASEFTIATEGFPMGLKFRRYDRGSLGTGANTQIYLLIDGAERVISTAFTGRGAPPFTPHPVPPFVILPGTLSRDDLIDKSDGTARVTVSDARHDGKFIVVYLAGKRNLTWYVPEPLIHLILYCSQL